MLSRATVVHAHQHRADSPLGEERAKEMRRTWLELYGPVIAERLEPHRRYALIRVKAAQFAFSAYDAYTRALGEVWAAGLVPEPMPSTLGADLADAAPNIRALDPDLADLRPSDVEPGPRRFS
jgi:hypothetical protein